MKDVRSIVRDTFAQQVQLPHEMLFAPNTTLADVVVASEQIHNSVDLMEAFAKTANRLRREFNVRVRLPAFPLETSVLEVLEALMAELDAVCEGGVEAA